MGNTRRQSAFVTLVLLLVMLVTEPSRDKRVSEASVSIPCDWIAVFGTGAAAALAWQITAVFSLASIVAIYVSYEHAQEFALCANETFDASGNDDHQGCKMPGCIGGIVK